MALFGIINGIYKCYKSEMYNMQRFRNFWLWLVFGLLGIIFLALFGYSLCASYLLDETQAGDYPVFIWNPVALTVFLLVIMLMLVFVVSKLKVSIVLAKKMTVLFTLIAGCAWVLLIPMKPRFDQGACYNLGKMLVNGDITAFTESVYINGYPFQLGYVFYRALLEMIFGSNSHLACAILNVGFLALMQGVILHESAIALRNTKAYHSVMLGMCGLMITCLQPIMLTNLLYGNIPGISLAACSAGLVLRFYRKPSAWAAIASVLLLELACLLKLNNSIVCIALCLSLLLAALTQKQNRTATVVFAICLLVPLSSAAMLQKNTEAVLHCRFGSAVPRMAHLVMGLMDNDRMSGWYNGYTLCDNFVSCSETENRARVLNDLMQRLQELSASPVETAKFFKRKITSTWLEASFGALQINRGANLLTPTFPDWKQYIFSGKRAKIIILFFTTWTQTLYLGFGTGCIRLLKLCKQKGNAWFAPLIPALIVFGAFFYHALFETKSLYVFSYLPLMIPISAWGLEGLFVYVKKSKSKLCQCRIMKKT